MPTEVCELDCGTLALRQRRERAPDRLTLAEPGDCAFELVVGRGTPQRVAFFAGTPGRLCPQQVDRPAVHLRAQPRAHRAPLGIETPGIAPQSYEHFLYDFFG